MKKELERFSDMLQRALEPAEAIQLLLKKGPEHNMIWQDPNLLLAVVSATKARIIKSVNAVEFLAEHIKLGERPSGSEHNGITEQLFIDACNNGEWEFATHTAVDIISAAFLEKLREVLQLGTVYVNDLEEAIRSRLNGDRNGYKNSTPSLSVDGNKKEKQTQLPNQTV